MRRDNTPSLRHHKDREADRQKKSCADEMWRALALLFDMPVCLDLHLYKLSSPEVRKIESLGQRGETPAFTPSDLPPLSTSQKAVAVLMLLDFTGRQIHRPTCIKTRLQKERRMDAQNCWHKCHQLAFAPFGLFHLSAHRTVLSQCLPVSKCQRSQDIKRHKHEERRTAKQPTFAL